MGEIEDEVEDVIEDEQRESSDEVGQKDIIIILYFLFHIKCKGISEIFCGKA